jgi:hypothetical protein
MLGPVRVVGVAGMAFTVTTEDEEVVAHPAAEVTVTV